MTLVAALCFITTNSISFVLSQGRIAQGIGRKHFFLKLRSNVEANVNLCYIWFQRKDIHRFSWMSNDGHTRKEIDHVVISRRSAIQQCRVYRTFDVDSDHSPVIAMLKVSSGGTDPDHRRSFARTYHAWRISE